ncbi:MotA/TolQ/ExbB proton channel family protein [Verrucomicrobiales bacterium]|nr:MotA/TolQ/ExbB proton channel family protein [Verrucomicrobiales bacterium]MDA7926924.1 MotA/TolQ/ExbB proton channel family protein [Verrucomicrobiales bacterium]MDB4358733.1 MotA/TolQ/ExbB proton channel family protein [Verrucomicrobiales bacterium]
MMRKKYVIGVVLLALSAGFSELKAQDDFDLGLPGDAVEVNVPVPNSAAPTPGGASSGEVNLLEMIQAGGWSMWVLGTMSLVVIGLLVFCCIDLQRKNFAPADYVQALEGDMQAADLDGAMYKINVTPNCLSSVMTEAIQCISDRGYESIDSEKLSETMADASIDFNRGRVRTINYFSIIAQAAPMMGLLGTVSGMIGAFAKLSSGGTGDPSAFAGNISEALITTATGLVVALPAIFCYFIFRDRLQQLAAETDKGAGRLISTLRRTVVNCEAGEGE